MTQPTGQLWMALLTCLWLHGCLSAGVMQLATGPRYRFARMTEVTEAALVGTDVFVRIGLLRPDRTEPEPVVLKVATDQARWEFSHSVPQVSYLWGAPLAHVPADALEATGAIPKDGVPLRIESIEIHRSDGLRNLHESSCHRIRVLVVHYEPEDDDLSLFADYRQGVPPPGDPLLVIVLPSLEGKTRSIFISDVQDGHTTRRPWLFLMPLAAAADVVLLPFEFGVALVEME